MTQAQILVTLQKDEVEFEPISKEIFISKGVLFTCPDGSEVWYIFRPDKYRLRRFEENTQEIWNRLFQNY